MKLPILALLLIVVLGFFGSKCEARSGDTLRVSVFKDYFWKEGGHRDEGALFPPKYRQYQKVLMRFTLAAPKDTTAGRWDYTMRVFVRAPSADRRDTEQFEIGRFITPYGGWFKDPWRHTWTMDVSPYAYLLHDSVTIRVEYDGYTQGSLFSLDFDCVEGKPSLQVYRVENIWNGSFVYGDAKDPIAKTLNQKEVSIDSSADVVLLRLFTTGHGFGTDGAAEFTDKTHHIAINDTTRFAQHLWRTDCGQNPLYPQAGTWYYSRGGWCPGDIVHPWDFTITQYVKRGEMAKIAYRMAEYENLDTANSARYLITGQILYGTAPRYHLDAAVEDILAPTDAFEHRRINPICSLDTERIVLRNLGSDVLRSVTINYGIDANLASAFVWHGALQFMDTAVVTLPGIELPEGERYFSVHLEKPNDGSDQNESNDVMSVPYTSVSSYTSPLQLKLQVDKVLPKDSVSNSIVYDVYSEAGTHLYHNADLRDSEFVIDTFALDPGCYHFIIQDTGMSQSGGDGLYPIFKGASAGSYRLADANDSVIREATKKNRLANFGPYEILTFRIDGTSARNDERPTSKITVTELPKKSAIEIDCSKFAARGSEYVRVGVFDLLDHAIYSKALDPRASRRVVVPMSGEPAGSYYVRVESPFAKSSTKFTWGRSLEH